MQEWHKDTGYVNNWRVKTSSNICSMFTIPINCCKIKHHADTKTQYLGDLKICYFTKITCTGNIYYVIQISLNMHGKFAGHYCHQDYSCTWPAYIVLQYNWLQPFGENYHNSFYKWTVRIVHTLRIIGLALYSWKLFCCATLQFLFFFKNENQPDWNMIHVHAFYI